MRSMTGYGRGSAQIDVPGEIERKSPIEHRFLDVAFRMPRSLSFLEEEARRVLGERLARGHVDVYISYQNLREDARTVLVDPAMLSAHKKALEEIARLSGARLDVTALELSQLADVVSVQEAEEDREAVTALLRAAMEPALRELLAMREREGAAMAADLARRGQTIARALEAIERRAPETVAEYHAKLRERVSALLEAPVDEERLAAEVALMADRSDISEEIARLKSHIAQLGELLAAAEPVGRKLDFLVQEFNREANTISSKSQDIPITRAALEMKSEIEKLREQLQNVE